MGLLRYKAMLDPQQWKEGFFVLQKSNLFICPQNDGAAEDIINLKRLQELSESHLNITLYYCTGYREPHLKFYISVLDTVRLSHM